VRTGSLVSFLFLPIITQEVDGIADSAALVLYVPIHVLKSLGVGVEPSESLVVAHGLNPLYFSGRCAGSGWSQFISSSHVSGAGIFGSYFGLTQRQIGHSSIHGFRQRPCWQLWSHLNCGSIGKSPSIDFRENSRVSHSQSANLLKSRIRTSIPMAVRRPLEPR